METQTTDFYITSGSRIYKTKATSAAHAKQRVAAGLGVRKLPFLKHVVTPTASDTWAAERIGWKDATSAILRDEE